MAFDPDTGDLIDPDFIPSNPAVGTGVHAILAADRSSLLVSDQTGDVVHRFDLNGNYLGVFAPAGGANIAVMDNIRGMTLHPDGRLLVTVAASDNANTVVAFGKAGNFLGPFVSAGLGGIDSPFDVVRRDFDWLVGGINSDNVRRYAVEVADLGLLSAIDGFPEQIALARNGNVLVANFSGLQEGIVELLPDGTLVGVYNPMELAGYRGVHELANGNLLVTTGSGVHEISRTDGFVRTVLGGLSGRFIESVPAGPTMYCSATAMTIPSSGPASEYPSSIPVGGQSTGIERVTLHLRGLSHTFPADLDIQLVAPSGATAMVMSDVGSSNDLVDADLVLDDLATDSMPSALGSQLLSKRYQPTNLGLGDSMPAPAPPAPEGSALGRFKGEDPNGLWQLFVADDVGGDTGSLAQWCIEFEAADVALSPGSLAVLQPRQTISQHVVELRNQSEAQISWSSDEAPVANADLAKQYVFPDSPLFFNGPVANQSGAGAGGADISVVQGSDLGMSTIGFSAQERFGNRVADDFVVTGSGWQIERVTLFGYQTGSPIESTFSGGFLRVWNGPPGELGSSIVWGGLIPNRMVETDWSGIYRVHDTDLLNVQRPVMAVRVETPGLYLPAGTWWLDWQLSGSPLTGPFVSPVTLAGQAETGNALQGLAGSGVWQSVQDLTTGANQGLPFLIERTNRCSTPGPVAWLSSAPASGLLGPGETQQITVTLGGPTTPSGLQEAALCIFTDDISAPLIELPVSVDDNGVFADGFESP